MQFERTSPILLFTYKRLDTLKKTVQALNENSLSCESNLFIFSDAAKSPKDEPIIIEVRNYIKSITGFKSIKIIESHVNKGLANSIIDGVNSVLKEYSTVIVLEDDLLTTPNFLSYMNSALEFYKNTENVFSISGYSFNLGNDSDDKNDAYFINRGWSWGWATWKNKWELVDWEIKDYDLFLKDKSKQRLFARGGSDLIKMLHNQMTGKLDSWAIRWFYNQFNLKGLTLYPVFSKIYNEGFDNYATHTRGSNNRYKPKLDIENKHRFSFPSNIAISDFYQSKFQNKMGIKSRIRSRFYDLLKIIFNE
jgi:hypothetical protein